MVVFGGSWGSTLSLLYAQAYPERVLGMILRGIFLCRDEDADWFYQQGADRFYPDYWQDFIAPIPENKREQIIEAYYEILTSDDEVARMRAAEAWSVWEGRTSRRIWISLIILAILSTHWRWRELSAITLGTVPLFNPIKFCIIVIVSKTSQPKLCTVAMTWYAR